MFHENDSYLKQMMPHCQMHTTKDTVFTSASGSAFAALIIVFYVNALAMLQLMRIMTARNSEIQSRDQVVIAKSFHVESRPLFMVSWLIVR